LAPRQVLWSRGDSFTDAGQLTTAYTRAEVPFSRSDAAPEISSPHRPLASLEQRGPKAVRAAVSDFEPQVTRTSTSGETTWLAHFRDFRAGTARSGGGIGAGSTATTAPDEGKGVITKVRFLNH